MQSQTSGRYAHAYPPTTKPYNASLTLDPGLTWWAGRARCMATSVIMFSVMATDWGTPKPRNAVLEGMLVRQATPRPFRLGMLYALSMCSSIFSTT